MLPPSIQASHPCRCEDNSVVTIDFLSDDVTINLRSEGTLSQLKAPAPGEAFTDGKHTVDSDGTTIELTRSGKERSEKHKSELQSLTRNYYDVFCLIKKTDKLKAKHTQATSQSRGTH